MASIAEILMAKGAAQAQNRRESGNIYAQLISNLSSLPGQVVQDVRRNALADQAQRESTMRIGILGGQKTLQDQQIADARQAHDVDTIIGSIPRDEQGNIDLKAVEALAGQHAPDLVSHAVAAAQHSNAVNGDYRLKQLQLEDARTNGLGEIGLKILAKPEDLGAFQLYVGDGVTSGLIPKAQAQSMLTAAVEQPGFMAQQAQTWVRGSKDARAATAPKMHMVKPEETPYIESLTPGGMPTLSPIPGFTPTEKPKDEFQTFKDTYAKTQGATDWSKLSDTQQTAGLAGYQALKSSGETVTIHTMENGKPVEKVMSKADAMKQGVFPSQPPAPVAGSLTGNDTDAIVDAIIAGDQPPTLQGLYRQGAAVRAGLAKKGFNLAAAETDWKATQKHIATLNGAQQLRLTQAINSLPDMLDSVDRLASQWKGGRFPLLNKANLALAKGGTYGSDVASVARQLDAQIADVTADLGVVYMGGNSPTDHGLGLAGKSLSGDWDEKVLHDMVTLAKANVTIRRNSITNTGVAGASPTNPYAPPAGAAPPGKTPPANETPEQRIQRLLGGG